MFFEMNQRALARSRASADSLHRAIRCKLEATAHIRTKLNRLEARAAFAAAILTGCITACSPASQLTFVVAGVAAGAMMAIFGIIRWILRV